MKTDHQHVGLSFSQGEGPAWIKEVASAFEKTTSSERLRTQDAEEDPREDKSNTSTEVRSSSDCKEQRAGTKRRGQTEDERRTKHRQVGHPFFHPCGELHNDAPFFFKLSCFLLCAGPFGGT
jgi:hypothetical protein